MRFNEYIKNDISENIVTDMIKKVKNKPISGLKKLFKESWLEFVDVIKAKGLEKKMLRIINRYMDSSYNSLDKISRGKIQESVINEDFKHYWDLIKTEAFPSLSFFPVLQIWMEINTLLETGDINMKKIVIYGLFWLFLVSGKFIREWDMWRKNNPEEFESEGSMKNPLAVGK
jgi:hypothetical protein